MKINISASPVLLLLQTRPCLSLATIPILSSQGLPGASCTDKLFSFQTQVNRELNTHLLTQHAFSVCICAFHVCLSTVHVYRAELAEEASRRRTEVEWCCRYLVSPAACCLNSKGEMSASLIANTTAKLLPLFSSFLPSL